MDTVLITGGAGFIGRHLAEALLKTGRQVVIFDNFTAKTLFPAQSSGITLRSITVKGDIRDARALKEIFLKHQPDAVIHLAALSDAHAAFLSPAECRSINVDGLNNLLSAVRQAGKVRKFVFVSSSYVYGDFEYEPADELHPLKPRHIYGITKAEGEKITACICAQDNIDYTIVRPTAVYGFGSSVERVCPRMILDALSRKEIVIHNGGGQRLDFTHVSDLAPAFLKILESDKARNQVFNLSRGRARTIAELAGVISKCLPQVKIINRSQESHNPARGTLDITRASRILGFAPGIDIEEGIPALIQDLIKLKDKNDLSVPALH